MTGYLKARGRGALMLLLSSAIFAGVFALFGLAWQAALYAALLCLALMIGAFDPGLFEIPGAAGRS